MIIAGVLLGVGMIVTAWAQAESDPLVGLVGEEKEPLKKGELRLNVTLLRMAKADAARLLLEDVGGTDWEERLVKLKEVGKIEWVNWWKADGYVSQGKWKAGRTEKYRYVNQMAAADFWEGWQGAKERGLPVPDLERLVNETSEADVGGLLEADFTLNEELGVVDLKVELFYDPGPNVKREVKTWPLPGMGLFRPIFQPWELVTKGRVEVNRVFFLGAQMEAEVGGLVKKGVAPEVMGERHDHVLLAFGKVSSAKRGESKARPASGLRMQTWTLAVAPGEFLPWMVERKGFGKDEAVLAKWLAAAEQGEGVEMLACSSALTESGEESRLSGKLRWEDVRSFVPGGTVQDFRAQADDYAYHVVKHLVKWEMHRVPADKAEDSFRPVAGERADRDKGGLYSGNVLVSRPAAPARWTKWKSAMERDESEPGAVEMSLADVEKDDDSYPGGDESFETSFTVMRGDVAMIYAGLKEGTVHATFVRVVEDTVEKVAAPVLPEMNRLMTWVIETPLDWRNGMVKDGGVDPGRLGEELLKAVNQGKAELKGLLSHDQWRQERMSLHSYLGKPVIFFENMVNTAVHPGGIFFNTSQVGRNLIGDRSVTRWLGDDEKWGSGQGFSFLSLGEPKWQQWGMWVATVKGANAQNSGFKHPVFPINEVGATAKLMPGVAQLVAVMRTSTVGVDVATAKMRWYVARLDAESKVNSVDRVVAGMNEEPRMVQALVLKGKVGGEDAGAWLEALAKKECEVVDEVMTAGKTGAASTGADYYFPNGRVGERNLSREEVFDGPAKMPEGTKFASQVDLLNRVVGFQWKMMDGKWSVERDGKAPEVVTDVFTEVRSEWPVDERVDWKTMPKVTVNVQRPIFTIQRAEGEVPALGETVVKRLSESEVILVRRLRVER